MNTFTANHGITVFVREGGTVQFQHGTRDESCGILQVMPGSEWWEALREFFQAEADERLGRWRSEHHPEYFVVPSDQFRNGEAQGWVRIVHEPSYFVREAARSTPLRDVDLKWPDMDFGAVAAKFFDAHPEPKPWHGAKPGEVWVFEFDTGRSLTASFTSRRDGEWIGAALGLPVSLHNVVSGRRIWPEVNDGD